MSAPVPSATAASPFNPCKYLHASPARQLPRWKKMQGTPDVSSAPAPASAPSRDQLLFLPRPPPGAPPKGAIIIPPIPRPPPYAAIIRGSIITICPPGGAAPYGENLAPGAKPAYGITIPCGAPFRNPPAPMRRPRFGPPLASPSIAVPAVAALRESRHTPHSGGFPPTTGRKFTTVLTRHPSHCPLCAGRPLTSSIVPVGSHPGRVGARSRRNRSFDRPPRPPRPRPVSAPFARFPRPRPRPPRSCSRARSPSTTRVSSSTIASSTSMTTRDDARLAGGARARKMRRPKMRRRASDEPPPRRSRTTRA